MTAEALSQPLRQLNLQESTAGKDGSCSRNKEPILTEDGVQSHKEGAATNVEVTAILQGPYSRLVGDTEQNWCRAVNSGTGITVLAFLFSRVVDALQLQQSASFVQQQHPRLRSQLIWLQGRPAFQVTEHPWVQVNVVDATATATCSVTAVADSSQDITNGASEKYSDLPQDEGKDSVGGDKQDIPIDQLQGEAAHDVKGIDDEFASAKLQDRGKDDWMTHVEAELNVNDWPEHQHGLETLQLFIVRLYLLPENKSLVILRLHTAICDRVGAATVMLDLLKGLRDNSGTVTRDPDGPVLESSFQESNPLDQCSSDSAGDTKNLSSVEDVAGNPDEGVPESSCEHSNPPHQCSVDSATETNTLCSVEDGIPPGKAHKPFWTHGIDLLGYSLGTRRHALLPFDEPNAPRHSQLIHCVLDAEKTKALLEACEKRSTGVHGALSAAGMKAAAAMKSLGRRSEHFAICSLLNCRQLLQPQLSVSTVGFYHSALMNTHHVNEHTDFWDLAKRSSSSLQHAVKHGKHFTDMGDLNYLMFQALQHPGLTPSSSMRTSLLVVFEDSLVDEMGDLTEALGLEDYLGCSSIHGVGPTLAIFDSIRKGSLHFSGVYAAPLYSREQIRTYVKLMVDFMVEALDA